MSSEANPFFEKLSKTLARFVVTRRHIILTVSAFASLLMLWSAAHIRFDPGFDKSIPLSHPYMANYTKYKATFGGSNAVTIAIFAKDGDIFNREFLDALRDLTADVLRLPSVDGATVTSLFTPNVNYVEVTREGFSGAAVVPGQYDGSDAQIARIKRNLFASPYIGALVSNDLAGALVRFEVVEVNPATRTKVDYARFGERLEELRKRYEAKGVKVGIIGFATFSYNLISMSGAVLWFFLVSVAVTLVLLVFYTGSILLSATAVIVALTAVVWQLGLVHAIGYGIDPLSILIPFLIFSIGVSHAVQMTNAWRAQVAVGATSLQAAEMAFVRVFLPGSTALLANAMGFAIITFIDIKIIRELGISASIGVLVMIITNKFLLPSLLVYLPVGKRVSGTPAGSKRELGRWERLFRALSVLVERKWAAVSLMVGVLLLGVGLVVGQRLVIGDAEAGAPEFWPEARYNRDLAAIMSSFALGIDELIVVARSAGGEAKDTCLNYPILASMDRLQKVLGDTEGVHSVNSITNVIKTHNVGNSEGNFKFFGIPRDQSSIMQNLVGVELGARLFDMECSLMPIYVYLTDHTENTIVSVLGAIKSFKGEGLTLDLALGSAGIMAATNEAVADAERKMLGALLAGVALLCYVTFGSLRISIFVLVPLIIVSLFGNAIMVFLNIGLKVSTLPVVALGVGVGVDYGIYLFSRVQAHLREGETLREAYYAGLCEAGSGIIFTAATMTLVVSTWAFSELKFQASMGVMLAYMFFVNMVCALTIAPALASWFLPAREGTKS